MGLFKVMIRLFFLIRSLETGGAERQLYEILKGLDKTHFSITLVTYYDGGELRPEIGRIDGIRIISLGKRGRWDILPFLIRLWRVARKASPDILYGFMGVANELCLFIGKILGAKVAWGLRSSYMDFSLYDWATRWSFRVGAWLSRFPDLIIVNSHAGKQHHIANGYYRKRMVVIPNGIDTERYFPNRRIGDRVRAEWNMARDEVLIGLVGRLDPMKDHPTFLRAAALLAKARPNIRFVCVGDGPAWYKKELLYLSEKLGLEYLLTWAGSRNDMAAVYNALDVGVSSSYGEGFSNAIAEAMACGVPCVVTDVGDSARIVGNAGIVVPPRDAEALCDGVETCLARIGDPDTRREAREKIVQEFNNARMVSSTAKSLIDLL